MIGIRRHILISIRQFGHGPMKKKNMPIAIHASQRPEAAFDPTFSDIQGLEIHLKNENPEIIIKKSLWTKPPIELPNLPFVVERTKAGSELPVYTDYKAGKTKVITILRKIKGDVSILKSEMEKIVGQEVMVKPGKLVVDGNHKMKLKLWLTKLGF